MNNKIECAICEREIEILKEYNGEPMCEECYHEEENEVFE